MNWALNISSYMNALFFGQFHVVSGLHVDRILD